jgi:23S rRNA (pseudouridine1915-N3)-methyltransferase
MKLSIAAIGQGRRLPEQNLAEAWFGKLPYPGRFLEFTAKHHGPQRQQDESARILAACPDGALLIAMDPFGVDMSSEDLAAMISRHRDMGCREAVFAIGGADGHHSDLLDRADLRLAFGRQTWPHMLFRAMLTEQLYRAEMILANHPYHHA